MNPKLWRTYAVRTMDLSNLRFLNGKSYSVWVSNPRPSACKADVITTIQTKLRTLVSEFLTIGIHRILDLQLAPHYQ